MFFKGKKREMFSQAKFIAFTGASSLSILITNIKQGEKTVLLTYASQNDTESSQYFLGMFYLKNM